MRDNMNQPLKHYSIIAIAGPERLAKQTRAAILGEDKFNKVVCFAHPDDYGDYPDTSGYERDDWESIELLDEDGNLYKYIMKCVDAVDDYVNKKYKFACDRFPGQVEKNVHWPKEGGKMFFVTGHVTVQAGSVVTVH